MHREFPTSHWPCGIQTALRRLEGLSRVRGTRSGWLTFGPPLFLQFYRDDLADECTVLAFRMLTKDLLVLFQAGNEGIINLLGPSSRSWAWCPYPNAYANAETEEPSLFLFCRFCF